VDILLATLTLRKPIFKRKQTQRQVLEMLGVFLFLVFFAFLCILICSPKRQTALAWWVKVVTETPHCTYYFGPFDNEREADLNQPGYVEDLQQEGATGIVVLISQCQPEYLTLCEEDE